MWTQAGSLENSEAKPIVNSVYSVDWDGVIRGLVQRDRVNCGGTELPCNHSRRSVCVCVCVTHTDTHTHRDIHTHTHTHTQWWNRFNRGETHGQGINISNTQAGA